MHTDESDPRMPEDLTVDPAWEPGPPKDGELPPIASGAASCRFLEKRRGMLLNWEAHWKLMEKEETDGVCKMRLDIHGRRMDLKTYLAIGPGGYLLSFSIEDMPYAFPLGALDNRTGNQMRLSGALGPLDSVTVSNCLWDFQRRGLAERAGSDA